MCAHCKHSPEGRPDIPDVSPLFGISGLPFNSTSLSVFLVFCLVLLLLLSVLFSAFGLWAERLGGGVREGQTEREGGRGSKIERIFYRCSKFNADSYNSACLVV